MDNSLWDKSLYFTHLAYYLKKGVDLPETETSLFYAGEARRILRNVEEDLGTILNKGHHVREWYIGGISKALGYKTPENMEDSIKQVKRIKRDLKWASLALDEFIENPKGLYAEEGSREHLFKTCAVLANFYYDKSGISNIRI